MRRLRPKDSAEGPDASIFLSLPIRSRFTPTVETSRRRRSTGNARNVRVGVEVMTRVLTEASISGKPPQHVFVSSRGTPRRPDSTVRRVFNDA